MSQRATRMGRAVGWFFLAGSLLAAALGAGATADEAAPAGTAGARGVIEAGTREVLSALRDTNLSPAEKKRSVGRVVEGCIDFGTLSRLALGPGGRELSEGQRGEFLKEFRTHVLGVCTAATSRYGGQDVVVGQERQESRGDRVVPARIVDRKGGAEREVAKLEFRLRQKDEQWQVIDLSIQGISLAAGFRAQFEAVMKDGGVERLLQLLREKNAGHGEATGEKGALGTEAPLVEFALSHA